MSRSLLPEERLLLALGKLGPCDRDRAVALELIESVSWAQVVELARFQRVHALLAANLEDPLFADRVPERTREDLRRLRLSAALRNERYLQAVAPAFARLADEGVPVLVTKGGALAVTHYPAGTRPLNDIDVFIRRRDYARVKRILVESGFVRIPRDGETEEETLRDYREMSYVKRSGGDRLSIDLHWRFFSRAHPYVLPIEDVLARARPLEPGALRALVPCPEDSFVQYATQIPPDGLFVHLGRMADLHALATGGLDWARLEATARRAGAEAATRLGLALARTLGAEVPPTVMNGLAGRVAVDVVADPSLPFERHDLRISARIMLIPLFFDRRWRRIAYFLRWLVLAKRSSVVQSFPPADSVRACLGRPGAIAKALVCGAAILAQWAADAAGRYTLAARLRDTLWERGAEGTLLLVDDAGLHDEGDALKRSDVPERVGAHRDHVG